MPVTVKFQSCRAQQFISLSVDFHSQIKPSAHHVHVYQAPFSILKTMSHSVMLIDLELIVSTRLASNSQRGVCLYFLRAVWELLSLTATDLFIFPLPRKSSQSPFVTIEFMFSGKVKYMPYCEGCWVSPGGRIASFLCVPQTQHTYLYHQSEYESFQMTGSIQTYIMLNIFSNISIVQLCYTFEKSILYIFVHVTLGYITVIW